MKRARFPLVSVRELLESGPDMSYLHAMSGPKDKEAPSPESEPESDPDPEPTTQTQPPALAVEPEPQVEPYVPAKRRTSTWTGALVMFGYSEDGSKVSSVAWDADGRLMMKELHGNEMVRQEVPDVETIDDLYQATLNSGVGACLARVDDVRSAFKYIGKSKDLAELLPEPARSNDV